MKGTPENYRNLTVIMLLLLGSVLGGCATPGPAPVVSRGYYDRAPLNRTGWYTVKRKDTLYSIAWRYGLDYPRLAQWNRIPPPYTIVPGQHLRLIPPVVHKTPGRQSAKRTPLTLKPGTKSPAGISKRGDVSSKGLPGKEAAVKLRWQWPTEGVAAQRFSRGDQERQGIKIVGKAGQPVLAAESGLVVYSGDGLIGYGPLIIVKHNNNYLSAYGHNSKLLVKEDDQVTRGMRIAKMGMDGKGKALLHFEIRRNGVPVDPAGLLPRRR